MNHQLGIVVDMLLDKAQDLLGILSCHPAFFGTLDIIEEKVADIFDVGVVGELGNVASKIVD